jgi:hypothetical protein
MKITVANPNVPSSAKDLISHLLCVDPAQRYTIDEFLAHPWCRESAGSMQPPPKTPAVTHPIDSPLLQHAAGMHVGRSPGLATLKEAFDITYAVHRMEEEGARRKNFLNDLDEEDEEDEDEVMISAAKNRENLAGAQGTGTRGVEDTNTLERTAAKTAFVGGGGRAGVRDRGERKKGFELNMGGATLLGYVSPDLIMDKDLTYVYCFPCSGDARGLLLMFRWTMHSHPSVSP